MGLDLIPMGRPKAGMNKRFTEVFSILTGKQSPGNKTIEEIQEEWFSIQDPAYETIKAPLVGRDQSAEEWVKKKYESSDKSESFQSYFDKLRGFYIIDIAEELDGVPLYRAMGEDEHVFRGEFLKQCETILTEEMIWRAWETITAKQALKYGKDLWKAAKEEAESYDAIHLLEQREIPDIDPDEPEAQIHIVASLAKWLMFYGKNNHGIEASF